MCFILYCKVFKSVSHNSFIEWLCNLSITIGLKKKEHNKGETIIKYFEFEFEFEY